MLTIPSRFPISFFFFLSRRYLSVSEKKKIIRQPDVNKTAITEQINKNYYVETAKNTNPAGWVVLGGRVQKHDSFRFKKTSSGTMWSAKGEKNNTWLANIFDFPAHLFALHNWWISGRDTSRLPSVRRTRPAHSKRFFTPLLRIFVLLYDISKSTFFRL